MKKGFLFKVVVIGGIIYLCKKVGGIVEALKNPEKRAVFIAEKLALKLSLTEPQKSSVEETFRFFFEKHSALKEEKRALKKAAIEAFRTDSFDADSFRKDMTDKLCLPFLEQVWNLLKDLHETLSASQRESVANVLEKGCCCCGKSDC